MVVWDDLLRSYHKNRSVKQNRSFWSELMKRIKFWENWTNLMLIRNKLLSKEWFTGLSLVLCLIRISLCFNKGVHLRSLLLTNGPILVVRILSTIRSRWRWRMIWGLRRQSKKDWSMNWGLMLKIWMSWRQLIRWFIRLWIRMNLEKVSLIIW